MGKLRITISGPQGCGKSQARVHLMALRRGGLIPADCEIIEQEHHAPHPQEKIASLEAVVDEARFALDLVKGHLRRVKKVLRHG